MSNDYSSRWVYWTGWLLFVSGFYLMLMHYLDRGYKRGIAKGMAYRIMEFTDAHSSASEKSV